MNMQSSKELVGPKKRVRERGWGHMLLDTYKGRKKLEDGKEIGKLGRKNVEEKKDDFI